jgi:hypothetical protein
MKLMTSTPTYIGWSSTWPILVNYNKEGEKWLYSFVKLRYLSFCFSTPLILGWINCAALSWCTIHSSLVWVFQLSPAFIKSELGNKDCSSISSMYLHGCPFAAVEPQLVVDVSWHQWIWENLVLITVEIMFTTIMTTIKNGPDIREPWSWLRPCPFGQQHQIRRRMIIYF